MKIYFLIVLMFGIGCCSKSESMEKNEIFSSPGKQTRVSPEEVGCPENDEIPSEQELEAAEDVIYRYSNKLESIKGVEGFGLTLLKDNRTAILLKLYSDAPPETESLVPVKIEGVFIVCDRNSNVAGCWAPSEKSLSK